MKPVASGSKADVFSITFCLLWGSQLQLKHKVCKSPRSHCPSAIPHSLFILFHSVTLSIQEGIWYGMGRSWLWKEARGIDTPALWTWPGSDPSETQVQHGNTTAWNWLAGRLKYLVDNACVTNINSLPFTVTLSAPDCIQSSCFDLPSPFLQNSIPFT